MFEESIFTKEERTFRYSRRSSQSSKTGTLKCNVKREDIDVSWLKNDAILPNEGKYSIISRGKERILIVNDVKPEDEGEYICQSGNFRVVLNLSLNSERAGSNKDEYIRYASSGDEMANSVIRKRLYINKQQRKIELKCIVPDEDMEVEWLKGLKLLKNDEKYKMQSFGKERVLVINNLEKRDSDDYTCQSGKFRTVMHLNVTSSSTNEDSDESVFSTRSNRSSVGQQDLIFYENDNANLKCRLKKNNESLVWYKDDVKIWGSNTSLDKLDKYKLVKDEDSRVLVINNLTQKDTGKYICQSKMNPKHRVEFKIEIKEPRIEMIKPLNDIQIRAPNSDITFEVVVKTPKKLVPYEIKWLKNNNELVHGQRYKIINQIQNRDDDINVIVNHQLLIENPIQQSDIGDYTLRIANRFETTAHLYLSDELMLKPEVYVKRSSLQGFENLITTTNKSQNENQMFSETVTFDLNPNDRLKNLSPILESSDSRSKTIIKPKEDDLAFTKTLNPFMDVDEGESILLECWVNKYNTDAVWLIDNKLIIDPTHPTAIDKFEIFSDEGRKHNLIIKNASPMDALAYSCRVNDTIQTDTLLNVNIDPPLRIVKGLSDLRVKNGETSGEFSIELNKRPIDDTSTYHIRWFVNNNEVINGRNGFIITKNANKTSLKFNRPCYFDKDNQTLVECRVKEIKIGLHSVELCTSCFLYVENDVKRAFIKKLEDLTELEIGETVLLEVRVNFDSSKDPIWYKNNLELKSNGPNYEMIRDNREKSHILSIRNCKLNDSGYYAVNVDGLTCGGELKVVDTPIKFIRPLQDQVYEPNADNSSLTLDCQLNNRPSSSQVPHWFKNGQEIFSNSNKYDMIQEHTICALIIYDLNDDDEGTYKCQIGNEKTECNIRSQFSLSKYLPNQVHVKETQSCTLNFALNRPLGGKYSTAITKWFKDGKELVEDSTKYWLIEHGNERSLSIHNCDEKDVGLYKAYIIDVLSPRAAPLVATNSCQMHVNKLNIQLITPLPDRITINEGDQLKLYCETLQENLKPKWFHNEIFIEPNRNNKEIFSTATQHFLTINEAKTIDTGIYKIQFGPGQEFRTTVVVNKPKVTKLEDSSFYFTEPLKNVNCNEGESITLFCRINRPIRDGDIIEWKKNKIPLINAVGVNVDKFDRNVLQNRNCEVLFNNNECGLILHNGILNDSAVYEINIIDGSKSAQPTSIECKANVQVTEKYEKCEVVKLLPKTVKVSEGDTLKMEVKLNKEPKKVEWFKNSLKIYPENGLPERVKVFDSDNGKVMGLEIVQAVPEKDDGIYQVKIDDKSSVCEVKVIPSIPKFINRLPDITEVDLNNLPYNDKTVSLECAVSKNNAKVKWFKGNEEISPEELNGKYELISEGPIRCMLIYDISKTDAGNYYCSLGSDICETNLIVSESKKFEPQNEVIEVYEGKSFYVEVDIEGNDAKDSLEKNAYSWLKNGMPLKSFPSNNVETTDNKNKHGIKIKSSKLSDTGKYELEVNPINGAPTKLATLDILVKELPIKITKNISVNKKDKNLVLECEVSKPLSIDDENSEFFHTWLKNEQPIQKETAHLGNPVKENIINGRKCQLMIDNYDHTDSGLYEFVVGPKEHPELKQSTGTRLEIEKNPFKSPLYVTQNEIQDGDSIEIQFETTTDDYMPQDFKWLKDDKNLQIKDTPKYQFLKVSPSKFKLIIHTPVSADNAEYTCEINNHKNSIKLNGLSDLPIKREEIKEEANNDEILEEYLENIEYQITKQVVKEVKPTNELIDNIKENEKIQTFTSTAEVETEDIQEKISHSTPDHVAAKESVESDDNLELNYPVIVKKQEFYTELINIPEDSTKHKIDDVFDNREKSETNIIEESVQTNDIIGETVQVKESQKINVGELKEEISNLEEAKPYNNDLDNIAKESITEEIVNNEILENIKQERKLSNVHSITMSNEDLVNEEVKEEIKISEDNNLNASESVVVEEDEKIIEQTKPKILIKAEEKVENVENEEVINHKTESNDLEVVPELKEIVDENLNKNQKDLIKTQTLPLLLANIQTSETNENGEETRNISKDGECALPQNAKETEEPSDRTIDEVIKDFKKEERKLSLVNLKEIPNNIQEVTDIIADKNDSILEKATEIEQKKDQIIEESMKNLKKEDRKLSIVKLMDLPKTDQSIQEVDILNVSESQLPVEAIPTTEENKELLRIDQTEIKLLNLASSTEENVTEDSLNQINSDTKKEEQKVKINEEPQDTTLENNLSNLQKERKLSLVKLMEISKVEEINQQVDTLPEVNDHLEEKARENLQTSEQTNESSQKEEKPITFVKDIELKRTEQIIEETGTIESVENSFELKSIETNQHLDEKLIDQVQNNEIIIKENLLLEPLKADKDKYTVGDRVKLTIKLSKPLEDDLKCVDWSFNGKPLNIKSKDLETCCDKNADGTAVYFLIVKKSKLNEDSGEYRLKLRSKPTDFDSEFYNNSVTINIDD